MSKKINRRTKIKKRIRGKIQGTKECPRLTVYRSNNQIYAQIIDDISGNTLASASSLKIKDELPKKEIAGKVGELIAQNAKEAGIENISFDRNGYLYHGRVRELANAARKAGLKF